MQEERDLGLAEAVDRLHRVADDEERAPVALVPSGGEPLEQLPLRDRGVLELVDQDVADAVVEREEQVARRLGRAEGAHGALRELGEVGLAELGEDDLELLHRERTYEDYRIQNYP